nr:helix-turn-helix transcriptional regulator [candidate division Zixibacteria bacterium]
MTNLKDQRGITQEEISRITGIPQSTIACHLGGTRYPGIDILVKYADYFRVTLYELTGIERLKDIEKKTAGGIEIDPQAKEFLDLYLSLPEDDWRKKAVDEILLGLKKKTKDKGKDE